MARPRIFISSTFFDLRQVRADLDRFIKEMGYEAIRNEQGSIPYGKDEKLEEYCYKEIGSIDILVSIIGGRYGSTSSTSGYSVSQMEINTALKLDKQVFIFIDKNVYSEFRTYLSNKGIDKIKYHYVDNIKIYEFIEQIESLPKNNPIHGFESSEDIIHFLQEQWAGLFQRFLQEQKRLKETTYIQNLENTANTLNQLIERIAEDKKDTEDTVRDLLLSNHPAMERLKKLLKVPYRVFFLTRDELNAWLIIQDYNVVLKKHWDNPKEEEWIHVVKSKQYILKISTILFDRHGNLLSIKKEAWSDDFIKLEVSEINAELPTADDDDDLPF